MKLLFIASDRMEFSGILARANNVRPAAVRVTWSSFATLRSRELLLVANGAGPERSAAAVDAALAVFCPDAIVSTGFCGALSPKLAVGDLVAGTGVQTSERTYRLKEPPPSADSGGCRPKSVSAGLIRSIPYVAQTADEKRQLSKGGAIAVEMEAAGIAARAEAHGIPVFCVRAVTDLAGETLANDFNRALRSDGHFDTMLILRGTLRQPTVRIPELIRLRNRCNRAARSLGEFFDDCPL